VKIEILEHRGVHFDKVVELVDEMLNSPDSLSRRDYEWVKKIDRTAGSFERLGFTPRQYRVLMDIYKRFTERTKTSNAKNSMRPPAASGGSSIWSNQSIRIKEQGIYSENLKWEKEELSLLKKYHDFYLDLESGKRKPETGAQEHFLDVCQGLSNPVTTHEKAYVKLIKKRKQIQK
jgi:uncharacterized protein YifE (UPF0438 family)